MGSVRTALYNYLFAHKHGGTYILRIEDTDQARKVDGAVEYLIHNMARLGIDYDEGPGKEGNAGPYVQSQRLSLYREHVEKLQKLGHAYPCFCSAARLEKMREFQSQRGEDTRYDGLCRSIPTDVGRSRMAVEPHMIRMKVPQHQKIRFSDLVRGELVFESDVIDDQVVLKTDGFPTYHLANVVDDHLMQISHVIRGEEWLPSTPKHVLLYDFFGWNSPQFAHLPLLLNPDRSKLSKRQGDVSVEDYLARGYIEDALVNFLALLGWNPGDDRELFDMEDLVHEFDLKRVSKAGAVFDQDKLSWMNAQYLRSRITEERFLELVRPHCDLESLQTWNPQVLDRVLITLRNQLEKPPEIRSLLSLFICTPQEERLKEGESAQILSLETNGLLFEFLISEMESMGSLTADGLRSLTKAAQKELSIKGKSLFMPIRVALTGATHGPEIFVFAEGLGLEESLRRINLALRVYQSLKTS